MLHPVQLPRNIGQRSRMIFVGSMMTRTLGRLFSIVRIDYCIASRHSKSLSWMYILQPTLDPGCTCPACLHRLICPRCLGNHST